MRAFFLIFIHIFTGFLLITPYAHAACTSPDGGAGAITWNGSDSVIWCDGTTWFSLKNGGARLSSGTAAKVCAGTGPAGQWVSYMGGGVTMPINTAGCGFTSAPLYFTSLGGLGGQYTVIGSSAIYSQSATGFEIYLKYPDATPLTPSLANTNGWYINWVGIGN